jgi:iron(III) transport system permease protein
MSRWLLIALCALLALPVLAVLGSWLGTDAAAMAVLRHQASTVMPAYALQTLWLALGVTVGVALLGVCTAALVSLCEFPLRRSMEWMLLLPLAMPAYVLAYATTDALQFSSPLHQALRQALGSSSALWPDVRSLPAAVLLFVLCLYPYVYLLVRTSLGERAVHLLEAARLLGAGAWRRMAMVALPLARPAIVAGVALALMETLADYGVGAYFGLTTFSTGIYRAWLVMNDATAAAQLASLLLLVVAALLWVERRAQMRLRFAGSRDGSAKAAEATRWPLRGGTALAALAFCALPVLLGFVLPVAWLLWAVWREAQFGEFGLPWARFGQWAWASVRIAALAALLATALALALSFSLRPALASGGRAGKRVSGRLLGWLARAVSLGYALPGAVIAVGILLPVAWLQARWPEAGAAALVTGSLFGVLYASVLRFSAVAMQSVEAGYARLPPSLDDTARMLGAGRSRLLLKVHLPLLKRSALAAGLLVFVDTMKELPATLALRPFGSDTLATVAYNFARDERLAEAALPALAIVLVGLIPVILLSKAMRH